MPTYTFKRKDGTTVDRAFPVSKRPKRIRCEDGEWAEYDFAATLAGAKIGASGDVKYSRVQWSDSCGVLPKNIGKHMRKHPHHVYCPHTGKMGFTSKSHRERCLRDIGFRDNN